MENNLDIYNQGQVAQQQKTATSEMMVTRQAQEVQAAMVVAKKFPRDEVDAYNRISRACQRKTLAEQAVYEYPRGGQKVTGPSIRLAEALAQNWGNLDYGIIELEQKKGESQVMAYAWDLETNTRQTKIFQVPHIRATKKGSYELTDPRDIYELVANQGARRLRACILGVIPGDVIDAAVDQCMITMKSNNPEPLIDRVRKMVKVYEDEFSVTKDMIEKFLGCSSDAFSENDFVRLRNVYKSLRDGMAKREDYFDIPQPKKSNGEAKDPFASENKSDDKEKMNGQMSFEQEGEKDGAK